MNPLTLRKRLKALIERVGEGYVSGPATRRGVFTVMARGSASTYVPDSDVGTFPRPIYLVYAAWDDPGVIGAGLVRGGRSMQIRAAVDVRLAGEAVARLLVAA